VWKCHSEQQTRLEISTSKAFDLLLFSGLLTTTIHCASSQP
jgi:hypothetical protein